MKKEEIAEYITKKAEKWKKYFEMNNICIADEEPLTRFESELIKSFNNHPTVGDSLTRFESEFIKSSDNHPTAGDSLTRFESEFIKSTDGDFKKKG